MSAVGDLVATLGCNISPFQSKLAQAETFLQHSASRIRGLLATYAPALVGIGTVAWLKHTAEKFHDIEEASGRLGLSIDMLQRLEYAASKTDVQIETLKKGFSAMMARIGAGGETMNEALGKLGLNTATLKAQAPEQTYKQVMEALGGVANAYERARLASELFGRSGKEFAGSIQNINEKMKEATVVSDTAVEAFANLWAILKAISRTAYIVVVEVVGRYLSGDLIPGMKEGLKLTYGGWMEWVRRDLENVPLFGGSGAPPVYARSGRAEYARGINLDEQIAESQRINRARIAAFGGMSEEGSAASEQLTKVQEEFPRMLAEAGGADKDSIGPLRELLDKLAKLAQGATTAEDFAPKAAALRTFIDQYDRLAEATRKAAETEQEAITRWQTLQAAVVAARTPLEKYAAALKHIDELVNLFGLDSVNAMRMQAAAAAEFDRAKGAPEKLREELSRWQQLQAAAAEVMRKFNPEMDFAHKAAGLRRMFEEGLVDRATLGKALLSAAGEVFPGKPTKHGPTGEAVLAEAGTDVAWRTIMEAMRGGGDETEKAAVATADNTARAAKALEDIAGRDPDEGAEDIL